VNRVILLLYSRLIGKKYKYYYSGAIYMRKPVNDETNIINKIWQGKLLNEKRQSVVNPSIFNPTGTANLDHDAHVVDYLKDKAAQPPKQPPANTDPTIGRLSALSPEDIQKATNMRRELGLGVAAMTDQPRGQYDAPESEKEPSVTNIMTDPASAVLNKLPGSKIEAEMQKAVKTAKTTGPTITVPDEAADSEDDVITVSFDLPSSVKKVTPEFPRWSESPHGYEPVTPEQYAKNVKELEASNNLLSKVKDPFGLKNKNEYSSILDKNVTKGTVSSSEIKRPGGLAPPPEVPSTARDSRFTPQDVDAGLKLKTGPELTRGQEEVKNRIIAGEAEKTIELADRLGAERKSMSAEDKKRVDQSAARLSKETGEKITPGSVKHYKELGKSNEKIKKELQAAQPEQKQPEQKRDISNVVPGSQMWGELSSEERSSIRDRYSRGEGPSISIRYNKETGKFDEPGYGDQGRYGDIVKALNMRESVQHYCKFITEMAKRKNTPPKEGESSLFSQPPEPGTKAKSKLSSKSTSAPAPAPEPAPAPAPEPAPVAKETPKPKSKPRTKSKTTSTPTPESTPAPVPAPETTGPVMTQARPIPQALQRPAHGGRVVSAPVVSSQPVPSAISPRMSTGKAAGLGAAAGASLLATILAITSRGQQTPSVPVKGTTPTPQMQPKPVNTENTPQHSLPYEVPPETNQPRRFRL
jgi:hypothetical protein